MSRLVRLESEEARGDRSIYRLQARASDADSFSLKSPRKSPAKLTYAVIFQNSPRPQSFLTPNS